MIANTKKQALDQHLAAVAILSAHIAGLKTNNRQIKLCAFIAGLIHDIGKIDPEFQKWVEKGFRKFIDNGEHIESGKFSFENHARHNEISVYLFFLMAGSDRRSKKAFLKRAGFSTENVKFIDMIQHAIYWHHAKPLRKEEFERLGTIRRRSLKSMDDMIIKANEVMSKALRVIGESPETFMIDPGDIEDTIIDVEDMPLPAYKRYRLDCEDVEDYLSEVQYNSFCNIIRSSVICADKLISALAPEELAQHLENKSIESLFDAGSESSNLMVVIDSHSNFFYPDSQRTIDQKKAADRLSEKEGIAALCGAAGCGKTKIAIEWARRCEAKKLFWIVPRVSVGQGILYELSSEDYLPGCKVELYTGEYKLTRFAGEEVVTPEGEQLTGDVIITTIDQLVNAISTHSHIHLFTDFMLSHAVFDEFHEFTNMDGFNLLFAEIMHAKSGIGERATSLLVSATPNYVFCEELLGIDPSDFVEMRASNDKDYAIQFEDFNEQTPLSNHPLYRPVPAKSMVISNTATRAQKSFLENYDEPGSILFHSKMGAKDRQTVFGKVFNSFRKNGSWEYTILRSAPIVQASLNITCFNMITEATSPENMLQRLGRLDRFGESESLNVLTVAIPESIVKNKIVDNEARFLNDMNIFRTTAAWVAYLRDQDLSSVKIVELYDLYKSFNKSPKYRVVILDDILSALSESAKTLASKITDPIWVKPKKMDKAVLKKSSIRGDSRYVQMIEAVFSQKGICLTDTYAFNEHNSMTLSLMELDRGDDSPINFMARKHHKITGKGTKHQFKSAAIKGASRSIESPIHTSYAPSTLRDLKELNPGSSIVYVVSEKQPIGCMRLELLNDY